MNRTTLVILFITLLHSGELRKLYYGNTNDPNAIVFEGPTNAETRRAPEPPEIVTDNDIDEDYGLDARFGRSCPQGYYAQGSVCFPDE